MSETTILKTIDNAAAKVSLRSDGIIQIEIKPNMTLQLTDGKEMVAAFAEIGGLRLLRSWVSHNRPSHTYCRHK